ncbi:hypothetical protein BDV96DRAFT_563489 [Lophiotrema nucula]|uniref:Zn(2)-C6 fungal-type domain-containing protein n=1 Tax=Lophiotrema nucula TaxID=690887 RepID=A0A6A5ZSE6_9PLEO|nr:hypothetical protein BDV96DRAFT_563489 [Lophiotrema nucula]
MCSGSKCSYALHLAPLCVIGAFITASTSQTMAGTKTSNRCDTCRQRKVKCDEAWPSCGSCSKSRRLCPGPPRKVIRWVESSDTHTQPTSLECNRNQELSQARDGPQKHMRMITLRTKRLDNGDQMHKIRLVDRPMPGLSARKNTHGSSLLKSPPLSFDETLFCRFRTVLEPYEVSNLGHGMLLRTLFGRFGNSAALDDAALCLLASHEAVMRGEDVSAWFDTKGYGRALRSVQKSIDDRSQRYSTETLAGVVILWMLEGIISRASQKRGLGAQKIHGKAMADMLLHRGIQKANGELELLLVGHCFLGDVQVKSQHPQSSSFDTPKWDAAISSLKSSTLLGEVHLRVYQTWIQWPGLLHDIACLQLEVIPSEAPTPEQIMHQLLAVASKLESLSYTIASMLADQHMCLTRPSMMMDPLVPEAYWIRVPYLANIVAAHSYYTINLFQMIIIVNSFIPEPGFASPTFFPSAPPLNEEPLFLSRDPEILPLPSSLIARLRRANVKLSERVWMMYEQAREWKPIGCQMLVNALKMTYSWAATPDMKQWILEAGKDLDTFPLATHDWEPRTLEFLGKALTGDLSRMKTVQKDDGIQGVARRLRKEWNVE